MALGKHKQSQSKLFVSMDVIPRSGGHIFYDQLQRVLRKGGIDSERGIVWRCADSLSLREFLQLEPEESVPDQSTLSRTRSRLPLEVHDEIFQWVIHTISQAWLIQGKRIGVDSSTMEANAAMRNIVRKDTGEGYNAMLERMGKESGIKTPTRADLVLSCIIFWRASAGDEKVRPGLFHLGLAKARFCQSCEMLGDFQ